MMMSSVFLRNNYCTGSPVNGVLHHQHLALIPGPLLFLLKSKKTLIFFPTLCIHNLNISVKRFRVQHVHRFVVKAKHPSITESFTCSMSIHSAPLVQPSVLQVEPSLRLLTDPSFHWPPKPDDHLEEKRFRSSSGGGEEEGKLRGGGCSWGCLRAHLREAEASGINTELTRTHQLEAGRNRLAMTTGNDGGRSKKTNWARLNKPADTRTPKPREEERPFGCQPRGFETLSNYWDIKLTKWPSGDRKEKL